MGIGVRKRREVFASRQAALENYASKLPFSGVDREALEQYVEHGFLDMADGSIRLACRAEDEASVYENSSTDAFSRLGELRCPMTVLLGESTVEPHLSTVAIYAPLIPGATFVKAVGRSHFGPLERAAAYAELLAGLLSELGSTAPTRS